jgi:hypothetical protein
MMPASVGLHLDGRRSADFAPKVFAQASRTASMCHHPSIATDHCFGKR